MCFKDILLLSYHPCFYTYLVSPQVHAPEELKGRDVIAFSYFFDRATERGLIDPFEVS